MITSPRVSVVIPTYNRAALLCQTIDSVLAQTFRNYEIIVVDDGSTDDTRVRLSAYGEKIRYLHQQNSGVNAARNHALRVATGDFIALLDSDDMWHPFFLELMVTLLERFPDVAFAFSEFHILKGASDLRPGGLRSWHPSPHEWGACFARKFTAADLGLGIAGLPQPALFNVHVGDIHAAALLRPWVLPSAALIRRAHMQGLELNETDSTWGDSELFARLSRRAGAVFVDCEAAINRSHDDAVRLTRLSEALQLRRRISMVDRVWRADHEFLRDHGRLVDAVQHDLAMRLAWECLRAGDRAAARAAICDARRFVRPATLVRHMAFVGLVFLPGVAALLRTMRILLRPGEWRHHWAAFQGRLFDWYYGVDTVGSVAVAEMADVAADAAKHAVHYEATTLPKFRAAIAALGLDPHSYTFLDIGSGKGRVLLLAARLPFRRVVGIEISGFLHRLAIANVEQFRRRAGPLAPIECVLGDARHVPLPAGNLLAFFYNPFDEAVFAEVVDRLTVAQGASGADLAVIYVNPVHAALLERGDAFRCVHKDQSMAVYVGHATPDRGFGSKERL